MLEIKQLTKIYHDESKPKTALRDINLTLNDKGMVFITGRSGSGKSTLLNILGGLDTFDEGEFLVNGEPIQDYNQYRNTFVGFIFQEYYLLENLTVEENIALALELQGYDDETIKLKVNDVLKKVDLYNFNKRKPKQLSGGQKQRVAIARALIKEPKMLICDEPTGNLDSETSEIILKLLKELAKERLIVVVTHDKEYAEAYGDRIIELKDGTIITDRVINDNNRETNNINEIIVTNSGNLSNKTTFKLAFHYLLSKKAKLFFMSLLFIIALLVVNVALHLTFYSYTKASYKTFKAYDANYIYFVKTEHQCLETHDKKCTNVDVPLSEEDIKILQQKYKDMTIYQVLEYIKSLDYLIIDDERKVFFTSIGFLDDTNLQTDFGDLPNSDNKIVISDYLAKLLASLWELADPKDVINKQIKTIGESEIYISGIINTDYTNYVNKFKKEPDSLDQDNSISYRQIFMTKETYEKYFARKLYLYNIGYGDGRPYSSIENEFSGISINDLTTDLLVGRLPEKPEEIVVTVNFINKFLNNDNSNNDLEPYLNKVISLYYHGIINWYASGGLGYTGTRNYTIVGILNDEIDTDYDVVFYEIDYQDLLHKTGRFQIRGVGVLSNSNRQNLRFLKELNKLDYRHVTNFSRTIYDIRDLFNIVKLALYGVGLVFTFFTVLLIYTFISTNIKLKQKDIGILTALGTKTKDLAKIFITESFLILLIPCIIQTILTIITMNKLNEYIVNEYELNVVIFYGNILSLILTIIISILIIFLSSYYPIKKLTDMKPINVIKEL